MGSVTILFLRNAAIFILELLVMLDLTLSSLIVLPIQASAVPSLLSVSGVLPVPGFWQESQGIVTSWEGRLMYKLLYLNITLENHYIDLT